MSSSVPALLIIARVQVRYCLLKELLASACQCSDPAMRFSLSLNLSSNRATHVHATQVTMVTWVLITVPLAPIALYQLLLYDENLVEW